MFFKRQNCPTSKLKTIGLKFKDIKRQIFWIFLRVVYIGRAKVQYIAQKQYSITLFSTKAYITDSLQHSAFYFALFFYIVQDDLELGSNPHALAK